MTEDSYVQVSVKQQVLARSSETLGPHTSQDTGVKAHYLLGRLLSAKEQQAALHFLWSENLQKR